MHCFWHSATRLRILISTLQLIFYFLLLVCCCSHGLMTEINLNFAAVVMDS